MCNAELFPMNTELRPLDDGAKGDGDGKIQ